MSTSTDSRGSRRFFTPLNIAVLGLAMLVLLAMVGLAYREWRQYTLARADALRLLDVQNSVESLVSGLLDAEAGQRAFLLSGEGRYLDPYNQAVQTVPAELANLNRLLMRPNRELDAKALRLNSLVDREMTSLREAVALRRKTGVVPATEVALIDRGKAVTDEIRSICFTIRRQVASQRSEVQAQALGAARGALLVTTAGSLFLMGLLIAGTRAIRGATLEREQALTDTRRLHELGLRLVQQRDLHSLLSEILRAAEEITGADMGNIQLLDAKGTLRIEAQHGLPAGFLEFFDAVQENQAACGAALSRRERIVIEDVERSPIFIEKPALAVMLAAGVRAVQSTPLIGRTGALVGMLSTHYRQPWQPVERHLNLIDVLAQEAADLIEKIRAEEALRQSEERYRATFDNAAVGIAHVSLDGRWLRFNDAVCNITGYSREELGAKTFGDITHPDDLDADWMMARRAVAGEIPTYSMEKRYIRKDGAIVWVNLTVSVLRDPSGAPLNFVSVIEDIGERKRVETANRLLASIVESSEDAVISHDLNGVVTSWNKGAERIFGYSAAEMIGKQLSALVPAERLDEMASTLERITLGEHIGNYETVRQTSDGRLIDVSLSLSPVYDTSGQIVGASRIARDITRRKQAEAALLASEERYRAVTETAADAIFTIGEDGTILLANPAVEKIFGYAGAELTGRGLATLIPQCLGWNGGVALEKYQGVELAGRHKDGHEIPLEISFSGYSRDDQRLFTGIVRDITERKRAEEELRATQQQLLSITESMAAAVTSCSRDLRYVWVSRGYAAWLGRPAEDVAGRPIKDVIGAQGYEAIRPYMERVLAGERVEFTARVNYIGRGERWIHAVYVPAYTQGQVDGWIAAISDNTDILRAQEQLRDANASLARANEDLERFAFVASHDLQEPLRMITVYSQLLIATYPDRFDGDARMFVTNIVEGTQRMRELLADLLAYTELGSRVEEAAEAVDLNVIVDHVLGNLKASIAETGAIVTAGRLPTLRAHPAHLASLLQNLIGNAIKYRASQAPRIHVSVQEADGELRFTVSDNGIGIDPKYHNQIFEVFKRLHGRKIPGTGVGLAICKRVVERYGGRIWVESHVGQGAAFSFTLPRTAALTMGASQ